MPEANDHRTERVYVNMTPSLKEKLTKSAETSGRGSLSADANWRLEQSFAQEEAGKARRQRSKK